VIDRHVEAGGLLCPNCGNHDPSRILLFAETIETDRYSFDRIEDGVPVFAHGKNVHTDPAPIPPSAECRRCHSMWTPGAGTCEVY
jgi:hypothetical protein